MCRDDAIECAVIISALIFNLWTHTRIGRLAVVAIWLSECSVLGSLWKTKTKRVKVGEREKYTEREREK